MTRKLLFANFKGGVGKTTNSCMTAYELARMGYKTLICDLDPQSNTTQLLRRTYVLQNHKELPFNKTMMAAMQDNDVKNSVVRVMDNLYLLPSYEDFVHYPDFLEQKYLPNTRNYKEKRIAYFGNIIDQFSSKFDYVIYDVPPTLSVYVDSALYDCDYIIIVLQTQQRSIDGAEAFFEYMQNFYDDHPHVNFDFLGVLPVLLKNSSPVDDQILHDSYKVFGKDMVFHNIIHHMERLKRYDRRGISEKGFTNWHDFHDTRVHGIYDRLVKEIIKRIGE